MALSFPARTRSLARPRPGASAFDPAQARGTALLPGRTARGPAPPLLLALLVLLAWTLFPAPLWAEEWTGKYANGTTITAAELQQRLDNHEEWLASNGTKGQRAEFPGADLSGAELLGANLSGARLDNADLSGAWLRNAILISADLSNADLSGAGLNHANMTEAFLHNAKMAKANLKNADLSEAWLDEAILRGADLQEAKLSGAWLGKANLSKAKLGNADLSGAWLQKAILSYADLFKADLTGAELQDANLARAYLGEAKLPNAQLMDADLSNTYLGYANLSGANLENADLSNAVLVQTDLSKAQLTNATLRNADLWLTRIKDARLFMANLTGAHYSCEGVPDKDSLGGIAGLSTLACDGRFISGPVQLRKALAEAGLRDLEREATYAIERARTAAAPALERWFRTVLFDWPSAYGMRPGRPLWLMLGVFLAFVPIYWAALWRRTAAKPAAPAGAKTGEQPAPGQEPARQEPAGREPERQEPRREHWARPLFPAAVLGLAGVDLLFLAGREARGPDWASLPVLLLLFAALTLAYWLVLWRAGISDGAHPARGGQRFGTPAPARPYPSARFAAILGSIIPGLASAGLFALPLCLGADCGWPVGFLALATAFCAMVPFYWVAGLRAAGRDGVYRVWSKERIRQDLGAKPPLRLRRSGFRAIPWAAYFSLLSSFNLGFREINVGSWIVRIQPREYGLQAAGWVRTAAGAQSLLSFYFLAWWVLTYFGRPFE